MPVFFKEDTQILYIHVPKTGGTFIEKALLGNGFDMTYHDGSHRSGRFNRILFCSPQHMHTEVLETIFDLSQFDYIFMTVREPLSRVISEFRMRREGESDDINEWFKKKMRAYRRNPYVNDNHIRPQSEFYVKGASVFRQDDRYDQKWTERFRRSSSDIKLSLDGLSKTVRVRDNLSTDTSESVRRSLTEESLEEIMLFYREDYLKFGYSIASNAV